MIQEGITQIDIKQVLRQKAPSAARKIPGFMVDYLIRTVHQDELNEILRRYHDKDGVAFMQELIGYFDLNLELVNEENIPAEGRYIFASNHPLGGLDGICLSAIIGGRFDGKIRYLVNDLLLLVSAHDESGTVWLYDSEDGADASQLAQVACDEVLQETPLGAYALEYLTYTVDEGGRGYTQLRFTAGYRRTAQQIKSIVHATNAAALRDLLQAAVENGGKELAVQVGSFDGSRQSVLDSVAALQQELGHGNQSWQVQFYPDTDAWGIMEIILKE